MFAMIIFPLLFPLIILVGLGMLLFSVLGTNGIAAIGKRSDSLLGGNGNSALPGFQSVPPGYQLDRDGYLTLPLTSRDGFTFDSTSANDVGEDEACMERLACELLLRGGPKVIGKKSTIE